MMLAYTTSYYTITVATMPLPCLTHNGIEYVPVWFDPILLPTSKCPS